MILKNKSENVFYVRYTEDRKTVERRIKFKRTLAEETNKIVAVFNNETEAFKLNQSILTNIGMNCFIKQLEKLSEEEVLAYLKAKAIEESEK